MGKRSNFERKERDFYPTPEAAVRPLVETIKPMLYVEPCAGDGALISILQKYGFPCQWASDLEPAQNNRTNMCITQMNAFDMPKINSPIITNPPWDRKILHPMIEHFVMIAGRHPVWLLFDADWLYTQQSRPYSKMLRHIIPVGRVKWIPGSKNTGKDNCAWYCFRAGHNGNLIQLN